MSDLPLFGEPLVLVDLDGSAIGEYDLDGSSAVVISGFTRVTSDGDTRVTPDSDTRVVP